MNSDGEMRGDMHGERWMHTGDVGFTDREGCIFICDRVSDTIVSGGENIYPHEIEDALIRHDDICAAAVIGVPDIKWGESVKAIVALRPGSEVSAEQLIDYCRLRLAGFKVPSSVDLVSTIPRNSNGEVLKRELREPYWQGHHRRV